jgi:branched-chain amino acid transport system ATP-binding protein
MTAGSQEIALSLKDIEKRFGPLEIIRGVNLDIRKGERHALIGPNGAGKSTLFHLISGRIQATSGTIELNGREIQRLKPADICRAGLSRSFQITNVFRKLSVIENLRSAVFWRLGYKYSLFRMVSGLKDVNELCEGLLDQIGLERRRDDQAEMLSYPEQRALELGLAIAGGADTLLLDEPMAGMSHSETHQALELIKRVSKGKTLLMVEHDMGVVFDLADRISVLVYGQVIATGTPEEIRANEKVQEAYLGTTVDDLKKEAAI